VERGWRGEKGRKRVVGRGGKGRGGKGRDGSVRTGWERGVGRGGNIYHYTPASHINI